MSDLSLALLCMLLSLLLVNSGSLIRALFNPAQDPNYKRKRWIAQEMQWLERECREIDALKVDFRQEPTPKKQAMINERIRAYNARRELLDTVWKERK